MLVILVYGIDHVGDRVSGEIPGNMGGEHDLLNQLQLFLPLRFQPLQLHGVGKKILIKLGGREFELVVVKVHFALLVQ